MTTALLRRAVLALVLLAVVPTAGHARPKDPARPGAPPEAAGQRPAGYDAAVTRLRRAARPCG